MIVQVRLVSGLPEFPDSRLLHEGSATRDAKFLYQRPACPISANAGGSVCTHMKNFYWIDSFQGYPATMDKIIALSMETYQTPYPHYTEDLGYRFRFLHLEDLDIACGSEDVVQHWEFGNIMASEGAAYVLKCFLTWVEPCLFFACPRKCRPEMARMAEQPPCLLPFRGDAQSRTPLPHR